MVALTRRKRKRLLWSANIALAAVIAGAIAFTALTPTERPGTDTTAPRTPVQANVSPVRELGDLASYAVIYERDLGYSTQVEAATAAPALGLRAISTMGEAGSASALFVTAEGKHKVASVGDKVGGAEVRAITAESVTVMFQGKEVAVPVEKGRNQK